MHSEASTHPTAIASSTIESLWNSYHVPDGVLDETRNPDGSLRPAWQTFFRQVSHRTLGDFSRLQQQASGELREHGSAYDLNAQETQSGRPWLFDPIPMVLEEREWQTISKGLQQRARLLDAIAKDLYGPGRLLGEGGLPPELLYRHAAYLHACQGLGEQEGPMLRAYAGEVARGPDGRFWVVDGRMETLRGMGYLLENRTVASNMFPHLLRSLNVLRFSDHFRRFRHTLSTLKVPEGRPTRVVLLTPGPQDPCYFEHAFLATYLGYTLVQGSDLIVRQGHVRLKALEGLQPVDVIVRYQPDAACDPLELSSFAPGGVAGLLEAIRRHNVVVINTPGVGLLEHVGLMPFTRGLCQTLLGEDLILPSAATWWCGQPKELETVLDRIDQLWIKPIDSKGDEGLMDARILHADARERLRQNILAEPWRYVGQEPVQASSVPVLTPGGLAHRPMTMRFFTTAGTDGYEVLPGALTRCPHNLSKEHRGYTGDFQGLVKDTWILSKNPVRHQSLWSEQSDPSNDEFKGFFTSSAAENLFWAGRYAERAMVQTQLMRVICLHVDWDAAPDSLENKAEVDRLWASLREQCGYAAPVEGEKEPFAEPCFAAIEALALSPNTPGGLAMTLQALAAAAKAVKENWSMDTWSLLSRLRDIHAQDARDGNEPRSLSETLETVRLLLQAFSGQCHDAMTRTPGWRFLQCGRLIERGVALTDTLEIAFGKTLPDTSSYELLEMLLEVNESLITYRRTHRTTPVERHVLHLLLLEKTNPKSLVATLNELSAQLGEMATQVATPTVESLFVRVRTAADSLAATPLTKWLAQADTGERAGLVEDLTALRDRHFIETASDLTHACFQHAAVRPGLLSPTRRGESA